MAEAPAPRSPLAGLADALAGAHADGITLAELTGRARFNLRLDPKDVEALTAAGAVLGGSLPRMSNTAANTVNGTILLWLGPDEWLVTGPAEEGEALESTLRARLDGRHHALTDVSATYATLVLSGPLAREVLMKGCRLDLHPRAFKPGTCVQTALAKANVILHQIDDAPTYEITVRNSFSVYLATWLLDAMAEYRPA
ncbi:MAG: sarcosine oxidase subunit gamma [Alphaproteobacteria bacterium]|nr:sarcosine oxidase subunit gamma [Alphaproteobacteria bacterium]